MSLAFFNILTFFSLFSDSLLYSFSHIVLPPLLLLSSYGLLRTFSSSGVRLCLLSSYRKTSSVSDSSVASDFHQSLDVHIDISSQVTLHPVSYTHLQRISMLLSGRTAAESLREPYDYIWNRRWT